MLHSVAKTIKASACTMKPWAVHFCSGWGKIFIYFDSPGGGREGGREGGEKVCSRGGSVRFLVRLSEGISALSLLSWWWLFDDLERSEEEKTCFRTSDRDGKLGWQRDVSLRGFFSLRFSKIEIFENRSLKKPLRGRNVSQPSIPVFVWSWVSTFGLGCVGLTQENIHDEDAFQWWLVSVDEACLHLFRFFITWKVLTFRPSV